MDPKLYNFLRRHDFGDDDVQFLLTAWPSLAYLPADDAFQNIAILVRAGYPEDDIGTFIGINPGFLFYAPEYLTKLVKNLGDDVEDALKNNPFLI